MSRFHKLSHTIWHCQYHIVRVPKYRYRILTGAVCDAAESGIHAICGYAGCEIVELNVCTAGSCTPCDNDTAEAVDIEFDGAGERSDINEDVSSISRTAEEALLGESFLGKRILLC